VRILLDTNVILDVALARQPFCQAAEMILDASDFRRIHLFITASSATDLYYVLRKEKGRDIGLRFIRRLLEGVDACGV
jgi:predicted nucleic acid-binding protein